MFALIFAAGLGTRLRPLTDNMPKALVPLAGRTLLEYQILKLKAAGITDIMVNVHHFPDMIIDYLREHDNFGCNILISDERDMLLDTGGGLLKAWRSLLTTNDSLLTSSILALNVDILSAISLLDVISAYRPEDLGLLVVKERETQRYLCFDEDNRLVGWTNIATGEVKPKLSTINYPYGASRSEELSTKLAFSGMQVLSPKVLPLLETYSAQVGQKFSIIDFYLWLVEKQAGTLRGLSMNVPMMDVGKIDHLSEAENFARSL